MNQLKQYLIVWIEQKIFHVQIVLNNAGMDTVNAQIEKNYRQIKMDVKLIVEEEIIKIKENDLVFGFYHL